MALEKFLNKFKSFKYKVLSKIGFLGGNSNLITAFGKDVYKSDIVNACIRCKAREMSKLQPRHIRTMGETQQYVKSYINRLLKFAPNELMTTKDFLEKCTWLYEKNYNCFIYPQYEIRENRGKKYKYYTGFYPLNPTSVEFLEDARGKIYIKLTFNNFNEFTFPYSEIIHWRKDFSDNELMGGDINGHSKADII